MTEFYIPNWKSAIVRHDGNRVQLLQDGKLLLELPWNAAKELARAIKFHASRAEQIQKVSGVIDDQAFLMRAGIPLGLTNRPDVLKEAMKEANWNRELRRAMPGGIKSATKFGVPKLLGKPPKGTIGPKGIPSAEKIGNIGGRP